MNIAISRIHFPIHSLGPGKRVGIWFQGCSIKCPGCISADTWDKNKHSVGINQVINLLNEWLPEADGITVSGGEPFEQPEQLKVILSTAREHKHINSMVYSGYQFERLDEHLIELDGLIDALMSDPFDISQAQSLPLRGSDNQRLFGLTARGKTLVDTINKAHSDDSSSKTLDLMYEGSTAWMAGIPAQTDIRKLTEGLNRNGAQAIPLIDKRTNKDSTL